MSTFRGHQLAYRAFVRTPSGLPPMLAVVASCYYVGTRSTISLLPSGDRTWRVVESEPAIAVAPVIWSVAAVAAPAGHHAPPAIEIQSGSISQQVPVEQWHDTWPERTRRSPDPERDGLCAVSGIEYKALARPHDTSGRSVVFVFAACSSPEGGRELFLERMAVSEWTLHERPCDAAPPWQIAAATTSIAVDTMDTDTIRVRDGYGTCPVAVEPWHRGSTAIAALPRREPRLRAR